MDENLKKNEAASLKHRRDSVCSELDVVILIFPVLDGFPDAAVVVGIPVLIPKDCPQRCVYGGFGRIDPLCRAIPVDGRKPVGESAQ